MNIKCLVMFPILFFVGSLAFAAGGGGGGFSLGFNAGFINAAQKDFNKEIDARASTTGAKNFGNAWEVNVPMFIRMSSVPLALGIRPSFFYYPQEKSGGAKYDLSGFSIFPMLKWVMLEDQTIKFYSQFGLGYGFMSGKVSDNGFDAKFSGGDLGYMAGLGAEFCFGNGNCINVEGSVRFMGIDRMSVDSSSGTPPTGSSVTQYAPGNEFEINGRDFSATMSGVIAMLGYTMYF